MNSWLRLLVRSRWRAALALAGALLGASCIATADVVSLHPVADAALFEVNPANNFGGYTNMPVGATGPNTGGLRGRGLLRFDVAAALPAGATITAVSLTLTLTRASGGAGDVGFELHRVLRDWGEGNKSGGSGAPATTDEASWLARRAPDQLWSQPGAAAPEDFAVAVSASLPVGSALAAYTFASTPALVADAQAWLTNDNANFGWILICQAELTQQTAHRFATREDTANSPVLQLEYSAPIPVQLAVTAQTATNFTLSWTGGQAPYQVQSKTNLTDPGWNNVGDPLLTNLVRLPLGPPQEFFRVVSP